MKNSEIKNCQNCKKDFTVEPEDFNFYEKMQVPPPTFCFDCRTQRKAAYLNLRTLYRNKCDQCQEEIIAMYPPKSLYRVFCRKCWQEERENFTKYGIPYDFSRPFFEQFYELTKKVPAVNLIMSTTTKNSSYSNYTYHCQNAYLSYMTSRSEDILYCQQTLRGNRICLDSEVIYMNERGYELIESSKNYNCRYLVRSNECVDSAFLINCVNCNNCLMSSNLRNKSYVFRNKQLTREEYMEVIKKFPMDSCLANEKWKQEWQDLSLKTIYRFAMIKNSENCTGDFILNSKNAHYSFQLIDTENGKFIVFGANTIRDTYDLLHCGINEACYEITNSGGGNNRVMFSMGASESYDIFYCYGCKVINNCFGCVGLKNKAYCILNKQYSKEEYEKLLPQIKKQMEEMPYINPIGISYGYGEFFPSEFSPFAYNESLAYEEFLLTKEEIIGKGYAWREPEEKEYQPTMEIGNMPDRLSETKDNILDEVIACPSEGQAETKCTFAYKIIPDELRFYRLMKIPLPRYCPNCRYYHRRKWLNPWKLWRRKCMCDKDTHTHKGDCTNEFETSYAPERPERIFCKECYQQEVY